MKGNRWRLTTASPEEWPVPHSVGRNESNRIHGTKQAKNAVREMDGCYDHRMEEQS
jgi:hypothetical protein